MDGCASLIPNWDIVVLAGEVGEKGLVWSLKSVFVGCILAVEPLSE